MPYHSATDARGSFRGQPAWDMILLAGFVAETGGSQRHLRAKQQGGWGFSWAKTGSRVLVELYAKLLGVVVTHWSTLLRGGPLSGVSPVKLFTVVQEFAPLLRASLGQGQAAVDRVVAELAQHLARVRPQPKRGKKTSTGQTLLDPKFAA